MSKSQSSLWWLVAVTGAPILLGWLLVMRPDWLPEGRANHGTLIEPAVPLTGLPLTDSDGAAFTLGDLEGKWILLLPVRSCNEVCRSRLWTMRQVRLALGEGRRRVERLLLLPGKPAQGIGAWLGEEHRDLRVLVTPMPGGSNRVKADGVLQAGQIHVVDPMGNLMMRYPPTASGPDILEDIERLLDVSENWGTYASH